VDEIPPSRTLYQLATGLSETGPTGPDCAAADVLVTGLTADSRQVQPGYVFVAIPGYVHDGHDYIAEAIANGATAIIYSDPAYAATASGATSTLRVDDSRRALAVLADRFYDHPSRHLTLVGVTGTNGKTTTVAILDAIFRAAGHGTGTIGTLGSTILDQHVSGDRTTPDAVELQRLLAEMVQRGVTHAAMEVTSHALDLHRVYAVSFAAAVLTNMTQDHLDWHGDMNSYFASKAVLFGQYVAFSPDMVGAINLDDPWGRQLARQADCSVTGYSIEAEGEVVAGGLQLSPSASRFDLRLGQQQMPVRTPLIGRFNVYNCLAAAATCYALGFDPEVIVAGLQAVAQMDGRFQRVERGQPFAVIVDYAHTPEALANVLKTARDLDPQRLICVFGCGGDRDRTKRPKMGAVVTQLADLSIITSDNPRSEDPRAIVDEIVAGIDDAEFHIQLDRRQAIADAIRLAQPGDLVLIAGKGHETYQEFATGRIDFDDRVVAAEVLTDLGYEHR
jgi:UDP-N-acetylmuramoyl-L-alanyl-D-glutamate--2,6-diaminopimelate ligase